MSEYTRTSKLPKGAKWKQADAYPYHDELDRPVLAVLRLVAQHADGSPVRHEQTGKQLKRCVQSWWGTPGNKKPPGAPKLVYRLPQLNEAIKAGETVYVVEGENKVELLRKWGLAATCAPEGAGKSYPEHTWHLRDANRVVILPDNDEPGRQHADQVGRTIGGDRHFLLELPGLPEHGDVVDWATVEGNTKEKFLQLAEQARPWTAYGPPPESGRPNIEAIEIRAPSRRIRCRSAAGSWSWAPRS